MSIDNPKYRGTTGIDLDRNRVLDRMEAQSDALEQQDQKARLVVAGASNGVEDCRLLLEALGLIDV